MGTSLGARVIWFALLELEQRQCYDVVENVFLVGAPVAPGPKDWLKIRSVVAGKLVNAYSQNDWFLRFVYRGLVVGANVAGLMPWPITADANLSVESVPMWGDACTDGVIHVDVGDMISGHGDYKSTEKVSQCIVRMQEK